MPEKLGRYEILDEIGQGGFATVYRAKDPTLGRLVALKALRPGLLQNPDSSRRFNQEARTIARLDHPRIVTIFELGQADQQMFIVMRLIEGASLDVRLSTEGPLVWTEALPIIQAVAEGLGYAHQQGVLHRDLKPANVLLDPVRGAVLSDFGLAKLVDEADSSFTAGGGILGTPHYMSPEQLATKHVTLDRRTDIYSLGVMLFECLTLQRPFQAPTREGLYQAIRRGGAPDRAVTSRPLGISGGRPASPRSRTRISSAPASSSAAGTLLSTAGFSSRRRAAVDPVKRPRPLPAVRLLSTPMGSSSTISAAATADPIKA